MLDLEPYLPESADAAAAPRRRPPGAAARPRGPGRECGSLDEVRWSIDEVDRRIVRLLSERRAYALQAARFKRSPEEVRVPAREEQVVAQVRALAREAGIEADLVEGLYRHLIDEFVRLERDEHRARAAPAPAAGELPQP
jgi:chorismate mutase